MNSPTPSEGVVKMFKELQQAKLDMGLRLVPERMAMARIKQCVSDLSAALMDADRQGIRLTVTVEEYERNSFNIEVTGKAKVEVPL